MFGASDKKKTGLWTFLNPSGRTRMAEGMETWKEEIVSMTV